VSAARPVVVVGAGLVGSLLANLLARRGHDVCVFEKRPDPRAGGTDGGRSINLVLTRRGIRALERAGLAERALRLAVPVRGRMMHAPSGERTYQPYGRDDTECNHSVSRSGLNRFLIASAERNGVRFRFGAELRDADFDAGTLRFDGSAAGAGSVRVAADIVYGADGAGSAVRRILVGRGAIAERVEPLGHGYKELTIPPGPDGRPRLEPTALHIWPRGTTMLMALANLDGSFTATLYLPHRGPEGFETFERPGSALRLFRERFADAVPLLPDLERELHENPVGTLGTVRCDPWHAGERVLLVGDAAHAIVPFFGQGMNSGFEDCTVLGDLLDRGEGGTFAAFTRARRPDAEAIADMALDNFVEMRDRVADAGFLLRKAVEHRLEQEMPDRYRSRYALVMYTHVPFRVAQEAGEIQRGILDILCAGIDDPEAADLDRARALIGERLEPLFRAHGVRLGPPA